MPNEIKPKAEPTKKYCSHCGRKLNFEIEPAEKFNYYIRGAYITLPFKKFNYENGKRNLIKVFTCPKYSSFFGSNHDCFAVGEPFNL